MHKRSFLSLALAALAGGTVARAASPFPSRPIRFVVHASSGGWLDATTRALAQKMSEDLGQPVIVDNRAGADGLIGIRDNSNRCYKKKMALDSFPQKTDDIVHLAARIDPSIGHCRAMDADFRAR